MCLITIPKRRQRSFFKLDASYLYAPARQFAGVDVSWTRYVSPCEITYENGRSARVALFPKNIPIRLNRRHVRTTPPAPLESCHLFFSFSLVCGPLRDSGEVERARAEIRRCAAREQVFSVVEPRLCEYISALQHRRRRLQVSRNISISNGFSSDVFKNARQLGRAPT